MTSITLSIFDNLNPVNPLEGVVVRIYNQVGDTFVTQLTSDSSGSVTTDVPDATYWVRLYKKGYSFASKLLIVVAASETNEWVVTGRDLTELPPSRADGICRVSGFIIDAQGSPSHLPFLTFSLPKDIRIMGNNIIGTEKVTAQPDSNGYLEIELLQDVLYTVTMASISDEVIQVKVPNTQACNITSLIYPSGKLGSIPSSTATVTVNQDYTVVAELVSTSGLALPAKDMGIGLGNLFSYTTSSNKLSATLHTNKIVLKATEAGTYTFKLYGQYASNYAVQNKVLLHTITVTAND